MIRRGRAIVRGRELTLEGLRVHPEVFAIMLCRFMALDYLEGPPSRALEELDLELGYHPRSVAVLLRATYGRPSAS